MVLRRAGSLPPVTAERARVSSPVRTVGLVVEGHWMWYRSNWRSSIVSSVLQPLGTRVEELPDRLLLYTDDGEGALAESHRRGVRPVSSLVRRSSLEDVFLRLTGRSLVD